MDVSVIDHKLSVPRTGAMFYQSYTLEPRSVSFPLAAIGYVLGCARRSKVAVPIVKAVPVDMVDMRGVSSSDLAVHVDRSSIRKFPLRVESSCFGMKVCIPFVLRNLFVSVRRDPGYLSLGKADISARFPFDEKHFIRNNGSHVLASAFLAYRRVKIFLSSALWTHPVFACMEVSARLAEFGRRMLLAAAFRAYPFRRIFPFALSAEIGSTIFWLSTRWTRLVLRTGISPVLVTGGSRIALRFGSMIASHVRDLSNQSSCGLSRINPLYLSGEAA